MPLGLSYTSNDILSVAKSGDESKMKELLEDLALEMNTMCNLIPPGLYEHYKGGKYIVHGVGRHSEDQTLIVSYQSCSDGHLWFRPAYMFLERVVKDGIEVRRFQKC